MSLLRRTAESCGLDTEGEQLTAFGAIMDLALGMAKILVGMFAHSAAMFADGLHSLSDVVSDVVVILSLKLARKQPTTRYAYGFKRVEALGVLFIGILLGGFALTLAFDAIFQLTSPGEQATPETFAIYTAAVCLVLKEMYFRVSLSVGKRTHSQLLIANAHHSRTDVYTSALVLIGLFATQFSYTWLDQALALFVSALVIWQAVQFIRTSVSELLDENLPASKRKLIEKIVCSIKGIEEIHELRARKLANDYLLECHLVVNANLSVSEGHYLGECAERQIRKICPEVNQISVHIDTFCDGDHARENHLPNRYDIVKQLQKIWADLPIEPDYDALRIHYREQAVELDVICPFNASLYKGSSRASYEHRLFHAVKQIPWLNTVHLYYSADPNSQVTELAEANNQKKFKPANNVVYLHQKRHHQG